MDFLWNLVLYIHVTILYGAVQSTLPWTLCTSVCNCRYEANLPIMANCSGRGLFSVPSGLPPSLKTLELTHNSIRHLRCKDFSGMSQLKYLDLSFNGIQSIAGNCCYVSNINVGYQNNTCDQMKDSNVGLIKAHKYPCTPFSHLPELETLNLANNKLSHLDPCEFSGLSKLQHLGIGNNVIRTLDSLSFHELHSLKTLDLNRNSIARFPSADIFQDLTNLTELNLKSNAFRGCYPDQVLSKLTRLEQLRLDGLKSPCVLGVGFRKLSHLALLDFIGDTNPNTGTDCFIDSLPENFFSNISTQNDMVVDLTNCKIKHIHPETFSYLPSLVKLDLSNNDELHCSNAFLASTSFPKTRIQEYITYNINNTPFVRLTAGTFKYIGNTTLKVLDLAHNMIFIVDWDVPASLPKTLEVLKLSQNSITRAKFLISISILINLKVLMMSDQNKYHISVNTTPLSSAIDYEMCHVVKSGPTLSHDTSLQSLKTVRGFSKGKDESFKRRTAMFIQQQNKINGGYWSYGQWVLLVKKFCPSPTSTISQSKMNSTAIYLTRRITQGLVKSLLEPTISFESHLLRRMETNHNTFPFPRSLQKLYASDLKLGYAIPPFGLERNVLWYLDMSQNFLWCFGGPIWGFNALKYLDLSHNFAFAINPYFFQETQNISHLLLNKNKLAASLEIDVEGKTFSPLQRLETLELAENGLVILHRDALCQNIKLKRLLLNKNNLRDLPSVSNLAKLEYIDLSNNMVQFFSQETTAGLDKIMLSSNVHIDLRGNPLSCDCSSLKFLIWFKKTNVTFIGRHNYTCTLLNDAQFPLTDVDLILSKTWRICEGASFFRLSLILLNICILLFFCSAVTCYFSYRLLFYIYLSKQRFFTQLFEADYLNLRDVFLVYDDQDIDCRRHVQEIVIPNFTRHGLTFTLSEIGLDSPSAGRSIREVVEESVFGGRKTVVLLTRDIFLDEEKQLEVSMAKIAEDMLGTRRLLFLGAQKINPHILPAHIYRLLCASRILAYRPANQQFWMRLAREIKH